MNNNLEIRKSKLSNAGWGVFVTKPFKVNDVITTYDGHKLPYFELHDGDNISQKLDNDDDIYTVLTHQDYIYENVDDECIYGYKKEYLDKHPEQGYGSIINDAFSIDEYTKEAFAKYVEDRGGEKLINTSIYNSATVNFNILATRDIEVDEELYIHYGVTFWEKKLNDDRFNEGYRHCQCANDKPFLDYVEHKYRNFDLRTGLNYTPNILED